MTNSYHHPSVTIREQVTQMMFSSFLRRRGRGCPKFFAETIMVVIWPMTIGQSTRFSKSKAGTSVWIGHKTQSMAIFIALLWYVCLFLSPITKYFLSDCRFSSHARTSRRAWSPTSSRRSGTRGSGRSGRSGSRKSRSGSRRRSGRSRASLARQTKPVYASGRRGCKGLLCRMVDYLRRKGASGVDG